MAVLHGLALAPRLAGFILFLEFVSGMIDLHLGQAEPFLDIPLGPAVDCQLEKRPAQGQKYACGG
jgi:hypothetical protein